ncbi:MAG: hypothetical protein RJA07_1610 [Bacteroidota bacterium]|jgi:mono/diheme cytochrome c family protein
MTNQKSLFKIVLFALTVIYVGVVFAQKRAAWTAPTADAAKKNPIAATPASIAEGKKLYDQNCSPCHGMKGKGDGAAAAGLTIKPANHTSPEIQSQTDGTLFWMITTGRNPMPTYKAVFTENQRWAMVNYIRTLAAPAKTKK